MKREEIVQPTVPPGSGPQAITEEVDKRRHPRIPVSVAAEVIEAKTRVRVAGRATDLGVGGCYVDALNTFPEGSAVEVLLSWRRRTLQLQALVSYAVTGRSIGTGMGLAFTGISADQGVTLLDWLASLRDEPKQESLREDDAQTASAEKAMVLKSESLKEAIEELVGLLVRKQLLTGSEGGRIRDRLSRVAVQDVP